MAVEAYAHSTLRDRVIDEFGLSKTDADDKAIATSILNEAQSFISSSRPDWPWRIGDLAIDVGASTTGGTGTFTQDSVSVTSVAVVTPVARDILAASESATRPLEGFLVSAYSPTTATLQSKWRSTTEAAKEFTLVSGWAALPADFARVKTIKMVQDDIEPNLIYKSPLQMKMLKLRSRQIDLNHQFYTVVPDPLAAEPIVYYLEFFPYLSDRSLFAGSYWRDVPALSGDSDQPIMPREDRPTLLQFAHWLMSRHLKLDVSRVQDYRITAFSMLKNMSQFYELSADVPDEKAEMDPTGWINSPPGYPKFGRGNLV